MDSSVSVKKEKIDLSLIIKLVITFKSKALKLHNMHRSVKDTKDRKVNQLDDTSLILDYWADLLPQCTATKKKKNRAVSHYIT